VSHSENKPIEKGQTVGCAALEGEKRYTYGDMARLTNRFVMFAPQSPRIREMSVNVIRLFWIAAPDIVLSASALGR
jgi:hypothetical protein